MLAAERNLIDIMQLLIYYQADCNYRAPIHGQTPLMHAAVFGSIEATTFLLKHGAYKNIQATNGKTARDYAEENGYTSIITIIDQA